MNPMNPMDLDPMMDTIACIKEALSGFAAQSLHIIDESPAHIGHSGRGAGGHFKLQIVSDRFQDKNPVQRHQMIYQALGDLMRTRIHALSIEARAPSEHI